MKIKIEIDESAAEDESDYPLPRSDETGRCRAARAGCHQRFEKILLYKGNTEYYVTLSKILFFETDENGISAHPG